MLAAIIDNSTVTEIKTLANDDEYLAISNKHQAVVDITDMVPVPQVGWILQGNQLVSNGTNQMIITKLALQNRFTNAEFMGILAYCDNTAAPYCYAVRMILNKQANATYIDLTRSDTQAGMGLLVAAGLVTSARASVILTTPPTALEIYKG